MSIKWYEQGEEPDYRFTLANERTFLAWLRTALALLAGAVAVTELTSRFAVSDLRLGLAVLLAASGTVMAAFAYRRWARVQRAMRQGDPLPMTWLPFVAGWSAALTGVVVVVIMVLQHR